MLSHDGFTFTHRHGLIVPEGPPEPQIVVGRFFGVDGEAHIVGGTWGRELFCEYTLDGYNGRFELYDALGILESRIGVLTGDLTIDIDGDIVVWPDCTFLGFRPIPSGPFLDGSGVHGWTLFGQLMWRQRRRAQL